VCGRAAVDGAEQLPPHVAQPEAPARGADEHPSQLHCEAEVGEGESGQAK